MRQLFGVIGNPISHSLSPYMQEAAFQAIGYDASYHTFQVSDDALQQAIGGVRGLSIKGLNVTIPHKVAVMKYLDEIDPLAKRIGAVNTIINEDGKLIGYNTDGEGYLQSLLPMLTKALSNMSVLIIGAGGAAKGVAITMAHEGVSNISIANRTLSKAEELATDCAELTNTAALSIKLAEARLGEFDLIVNTTPLGMSPDIDRIPLSSERISSGTIVSDLIYTPFKTKWLEEAEKKGATIHNGLGMFVNQGALAFEKWTGKKAPKEVMEKIVVERLGGHS